jgi:hypothetical protein
LTTDIQSCVNSRIDFSPLLAAKSRSTGSSVSSLAALNQAPSFITARNHFADDASDDWLGLEDDFRSDDLLKTPTPF